MQVKIKIMVESKADIQKQGIIALKKLDCNISSNLQVWLLDKALEEEFIICDEEDIPDTGILIFRETTELK